MSYKNFKNELQKPFDPSNIEWRISRAGSKNGNPWAQVLAYITSRAIMDRLDSVVGPENWKNEFKKLDGAFLCGISIRFGEEWVTKWDGAQETDIENIKGGISGSMKRAGAQWGIGRYLYGLESTFAIIHSNGANYCPKDNKGKYEAFKWDPPDLPKWALPVEKPKPIPGTKTEEFKKPDGSGVERVEVKEVPRDTPLTDVDEVEIHFGKNKGIKLGHLDAKALKWYRDVWAVKKRKGWAEGETCYPEDEKLVEALESYGQAAQIPVEAVLNQVEEHDRNNDPF